MRIADVSDKITDYLDLIFETYTVATTQDLRHGGTGE
jgi:hypothetical protein